MIIVICSLMAFTLEIEIQLADYFEIDRNFIGVVG